MSMQQHGIAGIRRLARRAERRMRARRAVHAFARAACIALAVALVDVVALRLGLVPRSAARVGLAAAGLGVLVAVAAAWAARVPAGAGAAVLDRFHGLQGRLTNAIAFGAVEARSRWMDAAIEDAAGVAPAVDPRQAVPIRVPRALLAAAGLACGVVAAALIRRAPAPVTAHAAPIQPVDVAADDVDDVREFLRNARESDRDPESRAAVDAFNALVDDLATRRLDRDAAFVRMAALEQHLGESEAGLRQASAAALERMGEHLEGAELTKRAGEALAAGDLEGARDALREVARRVRDPSAPVDRAKLDRVREALKKAAADATAKREELERRRQELADQILKSRERLGDGGSDEERSLLERKQRELERLDRDLDQARGAGRQLDRLDRDLEQAAEDLAKELGASADDLDQGAQDLDRMQEQERTEQEKEQLRQKLQELRELLRQQGQGGKGHMARLKKFSLEARGQRGGAGGAGAGQGGSDGQGGGEQGRPQGGQGGSQGGEDGQGGQGGAAQGEGEKGSAWVLGPGGEKMLILSKGQGQTGSSSAPSEARGSWGEGHDPRLEGKATDPKMGARDTQAAGSDTGEGTSRSQVIYGSAERGFASRGYQRVYTEYHRVAEEALGRDEVPGGYRFYVKRYFQLIRPREQP